MQKLVKNWIFTLVITIVLLGFGGLLFSSLGESALNYLIGVGLIVYIILVLFDNVIHYEGRLRIFAVIELLLVAMLSVGLFIEEYNIFHISGVKSTLGFVMWIRAWVEILHGYFLQEKVGIIKAASSVNTGDFEEKNSDTKKEKLEIFGIGKLLICICMLTLGVALFCTEGIKELYIRYSIAVICILCGGACGFITYRNRVEKRNSIQNKVDNAKNDLENAGASNQVIDRPTDATQTSNVSSETTNDNDKNEVGNVSFETTNDNDKNEVGNVSSETTNDNGKTEVVASDIETDSADAF